MIILYKLLFNLFIFFLFNDKSIVYSQLNDKNQFDINETEFLKELLNSTTTQSNINLLFDFDEEIQILPAHYRSFKKLNRI